MTVALKDVCDNGEAWTFELYGCDKYRLAIALRRQQVGDIAIHLIEANGKLEPQAQLAMDLLKTTNASSARKPGNEDS